MRSKTLCYLILSACPWIAQANNNDLSLLKPVSYTVDIKNTQNQTLYSANLNNLTNAPQNQEKNNIYTDNCIKEEGVIESTQSEVKTHFNVYFSLNDNVAQSIVIDWSEIVSKISLDVGGCKIDELVIGKTVIEQPLPFINFEYRFNLKNKEGHDLPEKYKLIINSNNLKNK